LVFFIRKYPGRKIFRENGFFQKGVWGINSWGCQAGSMGQGGAFKGNFAMQKVAKKQ
jgi:hypothetical protein